MNAKSGETGGCSSHVNISAMSMLTVYEKILKLTHPFRIFYLIHFVTW